MKKAIAVLLLTAFSQLGVQAQNKGENLTPSARVYKPKYLKAGDRASQVARLVSSLTNNRIQVYWEPIVGGFIMRDLQLSPPPDEKTRDQAEALLIQFDVPEPPKIEKEPEFTIYFLRTSPPGAAEKSDTVPADLASAVAEMKHTLPYGGFKLVDTMVVKVRHQTRLEGVLHASLKQDAGATPTFYRLEIVEPSVSDDGKTISAMNFGFHVDLPGSGNEPSKPVGISTDLVIHENQKLVLGKIPLSGQDRDDLWLVVTAKVK